MLITSEDLGPKKKTDSSRPPNTLITSTKSNQQTGVYPCPLRAGFCETKSKKGRSRHRKSFMHRVYSGQRGGLRPSSRKGTDHGVEVDLSLQIQSGSRRRRKWGQQKETPRELVTMSPLCETFSIKNSSLHRAPYHSVCVCGVWLAIDANFPRIDLGCVTVIG